MDLQKKIQQIKEKAEKEIRDAEKQMLVLNYINTNTNIKEEPNVFITSSPSVGDAWVNFKVNSFKEALKIYEEFKQESLYIERNSCTRISPQEFIKSEENLKKSYVACLDLSLNLNINYKTNAELKFWTRMGDEFLVIKIEIKSHSYSFFLEKDKRNGVKKIEFYWREDLSNKTKIHWATGSNESDHITFLFEKKEDLYELK